MISFFDGFIALSLQPVTAVLHPRSRSGSALRWRLSAGLGCLLCLQRRSPLLAKGAKGGPPHFVFYGREVRVPALFKSTDQRLPFPCN
jgi:hypothetical protein